jgi:hypothetical protein
VDAGFVGDDAAGVDVLGGGEHALEEMHGGRVVGVVEHGGADVGDELFFFGKLIELGKEREGLVFGEAGGEFGEGLGGDADGLNFVVAGFEFGFGFMEDEEGVGDLFLVRGAVEADEAGDGADSRIAGGCRGLRGQTKRKEEKDGEGDSLHLGLRMERIEGV